MHLKGEGTCDPPANGSITICDIQRRSAAPLCGVSVFHGDSTGLIAKAPPTRQALCLTLVERQSRYQHILLVKAVPVAQAIKSPSFNES
jgi:hypothetical protein